MKIMIATGGTVGLAQGIIDDACLSEIYKAHLTLQDALNKQTITEEKDSNVEELPGKVDAFVNYINDLYFDGSLDVQTKDILKEDMKGEGLQTSAIGTGRPKPIFNGDDTGGKNVQNVRFRL